MRIIPRKVHAVLDYVVGVLLIVAPFMFGFTDGGAEQWLPIALGTGTLLYSLLTRYELGLVGLISMPVHLALDGISGIILLFSPFVFGFADRIFMPYAIIGLVEIGAACLTETGPATDQRTGRP